MKRNTWTASQSTHRETRQEYMNRFKRTLVDQCLESPRGESVDLRDLAGILNIELLKRGYDYVTAFEKDELRSLLIGCGFTDNYTPGVYWK